VTVILFCDSILAWW